MKRITSVTDLEAESFTKWKATIPKIFQQVHLQAVKYPKIDTVVKNLKSDKGMAIMINSRNFNFQIQFQFSNFRVSQC